MNNSVRHLLRDQEWGGEYSVIKKHRGTRGGLNRDGSGDEDKNGTNVRRGN